MSKIQITARLAIHPGKADEVEAVAAECVRISREKDTGCEQYDWFMNHDRTECVVRETYRDSDALLEHMGNLGETLGAFIAMGDFSLEVYGTPSAALLEAGAPFAPSVYGPLMSQ